MTINYIFVTRLFSGMYETVRNKKWNPTGVPTITKLIDNISVKNKVTWIISCKTMEESSIINDKYKNLKMNDIDIHVIPFMHLYNAGKLNSVISDIRTTACCLRFLKISGG